MHKILLTPDKDPMGAAILDYLAKGRASKLRVFSSMFDEDEIPVKRLFRSFNEMPPLEQTALLQCHGRILDVGAGSGCHALALQERGQEVVAIDVSPLSVEAMRKRGVKEACLANFFDESLTGPFDSILLLMNGSGIVGKIENFPVFFERLKQLLAPGGVVWMDSTDLRYVFENEQGAFEFDLTEGYYGEVDFRMKYKVVAGDTFDWLYVDFQTLSLHASQAGFKAEKVEEGKHYDYLARISRM